MLYTCTNLQELLVLPIMKVESHRERNDRHAGMQPMYLRRTDPEHQF